MIDREQNLELLSVHQLWVLDAEMTMWVREFEQLRKENPRLMPTDHELEVCEYAAYVFDRLMTATYKAMDDQLATEKRFKWLHGNDPRFSN
jgi:hypothetical protein